MIPPTPNEENDSEAKAITYIRELSNMLQSKLASLGTLHPETNGNIAHHLAEVCLSGSTITTQIIPALLTAANADSDKLTELSHDLMTELQEIRENIDGMLPDVTALMNGLNQ